MWSLAFEKNVGDIIYNTSGKTRYTMPLIIDVWRMVTEDFEMLRLTPDFETLRLTCDFKTNQPDATFRNQTARRQPDAMFQSIASDASQTPARRNISKSGIRCKMSTSCIRLYFSVTMHQTCRMCCGQSWKWHIFWERTCDGFCRLHKECVAVAIHNCP